MNEMTVHELALRQLSLAIREQKLLDAEDSAQLNILEGEKRATFRLAFRVMGLKKYKEAREIADLIFRGEVY